MRAGEARPAHGGGTSRARWGGARAATDDASWARRPRSDDTRLHGRAFNHNEPLDFCGGVANLDPGALRTFFAELFQLQVAASRRLEDIFVGATRSEFIV
jgi:hypothetical protein